MPNSVPDSATEQQIRAGLVLGIDLGPASLGTALVNPTNRQIEFLSARVFPAGVEGDLEGGKEESRSAKRRQARLSRRQTQRRQRRLYKVFHLLQRFGLLPRGPRVAVLDALQRSVEKRYPETTVGPWFLRARALDHPLDPHELGRALYHLAQRRGFVSNRIGGKENDEERSKVKNAIRGLQAQMDSAGKRTLGEYMASLDPSKIPLRNNPEFSNHYTHRSMYEREFALIWDAQRAYRTEVLTDVRRAKLYHAMFHQRPLRDQSNLIGPCELEPDQTRAPLRSIAAQRFRVLGFVNNLRVRLDDGGERKLTVGERAVLLDLCEKAQKLSMAAARRALGLGKTSMFTIEEGGEKHVPVNLTATRLRAALGSGWDGLTAEEREDLVEDVGNPRRNLTDEDVARCACAKWHFAPDEAEALAKVRLPDAYGRYSAKALVEMLPALERGLTVEEAIRQHARYRESRKPVEPLALVPPVNDPATKKSLGEIRNPAVLRSLTELRKTVNAIVRRYGKPEFVRVELARDLKKSKRERQNETARNREREGLRQLATEELRKHDPARFANARGYDLEKYMLAMEAKWRCPYTGNEYGFTDVFGDHPSVDVEHIIPRSRSLDDSFLNKTLAYHSANAEKGNRTPREWLFESDPARYDRMIQIVKSFDPRFEVGKKLKRFAMALSDPDSLLKDFTERQLQDTRYASKLACRYLGMLYGGPVDASGTQRVFACAGQVTAKLRRAWDLDRILSGKPEKSRDDHRHHAIDALTVALSSAKLIGELATAAGEADRLCRRRIVLPVPWTGFAEQTRASVEALQVSHRPIRKLSGPLHEETFYSRPRSYAAEPDGNGKAQARDVVHYRVPLTSLTSAKHFASIVDSRVRGLVEEKALELGGGGNKFLNNWPLLTGRHGTTVPIKRVRIRATKGVVPIGKEGRERFVVTGSNHHLAVFAQKDAHGAIARYVFETVTMLEAYERKRQGVPVVRRDRGPAYEFSCTLSEGDLIEARRPTDAGARIWKVRAARQSGQLELNASEDARLKKDISEKGDLWSPSIGPLFLNGARKVLVNHLGEAIPCND
jgi:CRISPR-associated endonuclease Csn1